MITHARCTLAVDVFSMGVLLCEICTGAQHRLALREGLPAAGVRGRRGPARLCSACRLAPACGDASLRAGACVQVSGRSVATCGCQACPRSALRWEGCPAAPCGLCMRACARTPCSPALACAVAARNRPYRVPLRVAVPPAPFCPSLIVHSMCAPIPGEDAGGCGSYFVVHAAGPKGAAHRPASHAAPAGAASEAGSVAAWVVSGRPHVTPKYHTFDLKNPAYLLRMPYK